MWLLWFFVSESLRKVLNSSIHPSKTWINRRIITPTGVAPLLEYWCLRRFQRLIEAVGIYNPRFFQKVGTSVLFRIDHSKTKTNGFSWCTRNWMASKWVSFSCHLQLPDVTFQDPILCGCLKQKIWQTGENMENPGNQQHFFPKRKHTSSQDIKQVYMGVWKKKGVPQIGWFIMEIPIKMDDLGVPLFSETPISTLLPICKIYGGLPFPHHLGRSVQTLWSPGTGMPGKTKGD